MKLFGDSHREPNYAGSGEPQPVDPVIAEADALLNALTDAPPASLPDEVFEEAQITSEADDPSAAPVVPSAAPAAADTPEDGETAAEPPVVPAPPAEPEAAPAESAETDAPAEEELDPIAAVIASEALARAEAKRAAEEIPAPAPEPPEEPVPEKKSGRGLRAVRIAALCVAGLALLIALVVGGGYLWLRNYAKAPEPYNPTLQDPSSPTTTDPTQPAEPVSPVEPADPTPAVIEPAEPAAPAEPTEPTQPAEPPEPAEPEPEPVEPAVTPEGKHEFYTILLAGIDYDATRTDTIMVLGLDATTHEVSLMSIPRDTHMISYRGDERINAFYGFYVNGTKEGRIAGMEALMVEVGNILGYVPTGYAMVNLKAFVQLVDTIGGVDFDVPQDMDYEDSSQDLYIHLKKGYQHLDGEHAMQMVRFRGYPEADIRRTQVQQEFLSVLAKQCLSLSNIGKIREYCRIFEENVTTCFTYENFVYLALELAKCDLGAAKTYTLPGESQIINGVDYWVLYKNQTRRIIEESFNPDRVD